MEYLVVNGELYHHGIKGQKWGVRRFQNSDGTFNEAGKKRYFGDGAGENYHKLSNKIKGAAKEASGKVKEAAKDAKKAFKGIGDSEVGNRGKAALDVLLNGDTDWMGDRIDDGNASIRDRGKAALERLMYSEEQIENKKFFGEYDPFGSSDSDDSSISYIPKTEAGKRGKAALDVLLNGDSDWMGNRSYDDNIGKELQNRGKAALERLRYSEEQIENKKFFGRYDF